MITTTSKFAPVPNAESAPFWAGLAEGRLLLPYCTASSHYFFPPMPGCPECGAPDESIEHRQATGRGAIYSWTTAHYAFDAEFASDVPYTIVAVDLDEGPRIFGSWLGKGDVTPGLRVAARFVGGNQTTQLGFDEDATQTAESIA